MAPVKKPSPALPISAYDAFLNYYRAEVLKQKPNMTADELLNYCNKVWMGITPEQKAYFEKQAVAGQVSDQKRYHMEMEKYMATHKNVEKKVKKPKDPNAPKRPLSAFLWFCDEERPKVKSEFPEYTLGAVTKVMGQRWRALDADGRACFFAMAERDKGRYQREIAEYTNQGEMIQPGPGRSIQHQTQGQGHSDFKSRQNKCMRLTPPPPPPNAWR